MRSVKGIRTGALLFVAMLGGPVTERIARADDAKPDGVRGEGLSNLIDLALLGQYQRVAIPRKAGGVRDIGTFDLRSRVYLGKTIAHCSGLDGQVGGSDEGFTYGVTGYPVGAGLRWGDGNVVSLCGGAGLDRTGTAVPVAARFPADLSVAFNLGPVRPILWVRPAWLAATKRRDGASLSFIDELESGVLVRLAPQHRYWASLTGGGGLALGVSYRELMDTRSVGAYVGFEFAGGN
jgi:hypothetical protein